jgi:hypothetical protein
MVRTVLPVKLLEASSGRQPDRSAAVPFATAPLTIASRDKST